LGLYVWTGRSGLDVSVNHTANSTSDGPWIVLEDQPIASDGGDVEYGVPEVSTYGSVIEVVMWIDSHFVQLPYGWVRTSPARRRMTIGRVTWAALGQVGWESVGKKCFTMRASVVEMDGNSFLTLSTYIHTCDRSMIKS